MADYANPHDMYALGYERGRISADVNWGTRSTNKLEPFLTINAIDGSIIDRSLGY